MTDNEYFYIHQYLIKHYGRANKCEGQACTLDRPKRFEWALRRGRKYSRNINDYIQLCPSCHRKYDFTEETRMKQSNARRGKKANHQKPVFQLDRNGNIISLFDTITEAGNMTGTSITGIHNCLSGLSKSSNGFIWKRAIMN